MTEAVIRCAGARDSNLIGQYLTAYDLEAHGGQGHAHWSRDKSKAQVFPGFIAAFEAWRSVSVTAPVRADGQPNRPLTVYSVRFEDAP